MFAKRIKNILIHDMFYAKDVMKVLQSGILDFRDITEVVINSFVLTYKQIGKLIFNLHPEERIIIYQAYMSNEKITTDDYKNLIIYMCVELGNDCLIETLYDNVSDFTGEQIRELTEAVPEVLDRIDEWRDLLEMFSDNNEEEEDNLDNSDMV